MLNLINTLAGLLVWAIRGETLAEQDRACNR